MDFTQLNAVREFLDAKTTTDDNLLERLITAVSAFMSAYFGRDILAGPRTYKEEGTGSTRVVLPDYPVTAVASVKVNGYVIPASVNYLSGYRFDRHCVYLMGYGFTRGALVEIDYTAGFDEVPLDVEQVCVDIVVLEYKGKQRLGKTSEGLTGQSTGYKVDDWPVNIKSVLDVYKRKVPA